MRLPSRLPYSPLPRGCGGADTVSDDDGRVPVPDGRLAGRLGDRRTDDRDRDELDRGRDRAAPRFADDPVPEPSLPDADMDIVAGLAAADRDVVLDLDVVRGRDVARGREVVRDRDVDRRVPVVVATFADCMVLAAVVRAFAAVVMALVAVFIDCIAEDMVFADAVAFVAAAVILVAAEVTLVAAVDTPLAAVAGVVALRLAVLRRVVVVLRVVPGRLAALRALLRPVVLRRAVVRREAVDREAVDRPAVLRVDRDAVLLVVDRDAVLRAGLAAEPRLPDDLADDVREPDMDFDRLAVPRDALRLAGLLRAELAELRRVAARVVD